MTVGGKSGMLTGKNAAAYPQGVRCQKCLEHGHWTYECKGKRKFLHRASRTATLNKRMKLREQASLQAVPQVKASSEGKKRKKKHHGDKSSSSDDSSSSNDSSSSGDSSSDSSDSSSSSSSSSDSSSSDSSSSDSSEDSSDSSSASSSASISTRRKSVIGSKIS
ncbi:zinc finger CCHC domain-containing protein 10-like [Bacillus rossius redtenbacheri]|uniref:zinc finger CCHC domain-containing protein 10-like n=1 Tax=Bacillus rossius redtenbacheri TaxID=93214 RepID=UPI002FDD5F2C